MADEREPKRKFVSLKVKWAFGTACGSLLIFLVVAAVLFMAFHQQLMDQETSRTQRALTTVTSRLNRRSDRLTKDQVNRSLRPSTPNHRLPGYAFHENIAQGLGDSHLIVSVFNADGQRLFSTWHSEVPLKRVKQQTVGRVKVPGRQEMVAGRAPVWDRSHHHVVGYVQVENHLTAYSKSMAHLWHIMFLTVLLVIIASGLLGYGLSAFFLRRLDDVVATIESVKDDPKSKSRVPVNGPNDEITELGNVANQMIDQTQDYIDSQVQFVSDVSHELRTPITIIHGHLEMLSRWGKDDPKILAESLKESLAETMRLNNLIKEMIELTRAGEAPANFADQKTNVRDVLYQVYGSYKSTYPKYIFTLDDDLSHDIMVNILRDHLVEILTILCDNAVKYSADRHEVHLSLSRNIAEVEIGVQDFGIGIPADDIPYIFNRFYRVDKARNRKKGGNGLGLAIAKQLVEGYGGTISVESSVGAGSLFRVTLPILQPDDHKKHHKAGQTDKPQ